MGHGSWITIDDKFPSLGRPTYLYKVLH